MTQIKLAIGLPAYTGQITAFAFRMWLSLGAALEASKARFQLVSTNLVDACGIDVARNRLVADALATGADWLLMVDADTWHEDGSDILQMISDADRLAYPNPGYAAVVVAQVPKRDPNDTRLMVYDYTEAPGGNRTRTFVGPLPTNGLTAIDAAATAMMAINLNFIRGVDFQPPWFRFVWRVGETRPHQSEDLYFCERIRDNDGVILGDGRFVARHLQRPQVIGGGCDHDVVWLDNGASGYSRCRKCGYFP